MKNTRTLKVIATFIIIIPSFGFAQLFRVGIGGGLTQINTPQYYTTETSDRGLGFSNEWNAGLIVKFDPLLPVTTRFSITYHELSGSGAPNFGESYLAEDNIEYTQSIFEIGTGAQYSFINVPAGIDPYISLELTLSSFGDLVSTYSIYENRKDGFTKIGASLGVGDEVAIIPTLNVDIFLNYNAFNLFETLHLFKEDHKKLISAVTLDVFIDIGLL